MKRMLSFLTISLFIASAMSCKPRINASNEVDIPDISDIIGGGSGNNNGGNDNGGNTDNGGNNNGGNTDDGGNTDNGGGNTDPIEDDSRKLKLTQPGNSYYERFIDRWDNMNGATIDLGINEMSSDKKDGRIWMVGVQAVRPGEPVVINPKVYGKGTSTIGFNWFNDQIKVMGIKFNINQPLPLIAPVGVAKGEAIDPDLFPNDPAVVYNNGRNSTFITLAYGHMLQNTSNKNGAGSLLKAAAWSNIGFKAGDDVDLVVYLYTTQQSYGWYTKTVGLNPETGIPKALQGVTLDHIIEVQRFPFILQ